MAKEHVDIVVSGAGPAGMIAAAAFAHKGLKTILVDKNALVAKPPKDISDLRSTAFLNPAVDLLDEIGLWDKLDHTACPLEIMQLADAGGVENDIRHVADFNAQELGSPAFGYNVSNAVLRAEALKILHKNKNVELIGNSSIELIAARDNETHLRIEDRQIHTNALIVAEGRASKTRDALGIEMSKTDYGQSALVFVVSHTRPHKNTSIEIHRTGGPFTLVPMLSENGKHMSSVVWMERSEDAASLEKLSDVEFQKAVQDRSNGILGKVKLQSKRQSFPIISAIAKNIGYARCYLIAESAHVVPPIGAQGLNMSLADIRWLYDRSEDLVSKNISADYEAARRSDMAQRRQGIDALNRAAMAKAQGFRDLRLQGLKLLHGIKPIRQGLMRKGLGL